MHKLTSANLESSSKGVLHSVTSELQKQINTEHDLQEDPPTWDLICDIGMTLYFCVSSWDNCIYFAFSLQTYHLIDSNGR